MTKDKEFLNALQKSFKTYLETNARSNEKLKILHKKYQMTSYLYLVMGILLILWG